MVLLPGVARLKWRHAKIVHYNPKLPSFPSFSSESELLSQTEPASISIAFAGGHDGFVSRAGKTSRRTVAAAAITLCGPEPITWLGGSGATEFIEITASPAFRQELAEELGVSHNADLDDIHGFTDPIVWAAGARLRSAARRSIALGDIERDALLRHLYGRIFSQRFGGRPSARGDGGLDPVRLNRVLEFIDAHLEHELTIDALAQVVALSSFHFIRAFRRSTGLPPQRYARARRLERARELMALGADPRSAARRIGYESLNHFRSAYRAHFGHPYEAVLDRH